MATYYVDAENGNNANNGSSWTLAKKDIQNAVELITGVITDEVIIKLNADSDVDYVGDVHIENIVCAGADAKLLFHAESNTDQTPHGDIVWTEENYQGYTYSPYASGQTGTWNPKTDDKPVIIQGDIKVTNSVNVEFRGVSFESSKTESGESARIIVTDGCIVNCVYCRFENINAGVINLGGLVTLENCYFLGNRMPVMGMMRGTTILMGNTTIEDPIELGIFARQQAIVVAHPWLVEPSTFATLEIKVTKARKDLKAIKVVEGSQFKLWDGLTSKDPDIAKLLINHEYKTISANFVAILLESGGMLIGADQIEYITKDAKDDVVEMPEKNRIVVSSTEGCLSID